MKSTTTDNTTFLEIWNKTTKGLHHSKDLIVFKGYIAISVHKVKLRKVRSNFQRQSEKSENNKTVK